MRTSKLVSYFSLQTLLQPPRQPLLHSKIHYPVIVEAHVSLLFSSTSTLVTGHTGAVKPKRVANHYKRLPQSKSNYRLPVQLKPFTRANLQHRRKSTHGSQERSQLLVLLDLVAIPVSVPLSTCHYPGVLLNYLYQQPVAMSRTRGVRRVAIRCAGLERQRRDGGKAIRTLCMKTRKGTPNTRQANRCQSLSVTATLPGLNVAASSRRPLTILDHQSSDGQLSLIAVIAPLQCQTT